MPVEAYDVNSLYRCTDAPCPNNTHANVLVNVLGCCGIACQKYVHMINTVCAALCFILIFIFVLPVFYACYRQRSIIDFGSWCDCVCLEVASIQHILIYVCVCMCMWKSE